MKKTLKLIPAIAMLLISAVLVSTSTYAWFSMNTQVTATGMQVKAQAEGGIAIAPINGSGEPGSYAQTAVATYSGTSTTLVPTSTKTCADNAWYHASSDSPDSYAKAENVSYENLSFTDVAAGTITTGTAPNTTTKQYYLLNKFSIKSTDGKATTDPLYVTGVSAVVDGTSASGALNKALRVAIVANGNAFIYAPVEGATNNYKVEGDTNKQVTLCAVNQQILNSVPAAGTTVSIYIFYEGEDEQCKSANIVTTIDTLKVEVTFGTTTVNS